MFRALYLTSIISNALLGLGLGLGLGAQVVQAVDPRVIGGTDPGGLIPYQALIFFSQEGTDGNFQCGGSLIAPNVVLTAAHCSLGDNTEYTVIFGAYNLDELLTDQNIEVRVSIDAMIDPKYSEDESMTPNYDFLLLLLNEPITTFDPITLDGGTSDTTTELTDGDVLFVSGWGTTENEGVASNLLLEAQLNYVPVMQCNEGYGGLVDDHEICASSPGKDACQGDSGGPLVVRESVDGGASSNDILVGVVSWGFECANPDYPGVYGRVQYAFDWIQSVLCDDWSSSGVVSEYCGPVAPTTPAPTISHKPTQVPVAPTTPAPTISHKPTRVPTVCTDVSDFVDAFGDNCTYYEENDVQGCPVWSDCQSCNVGFGTPGEACCWCGGGNDGPVAPSTPAPTIFCEDYPQYTDVFGDSCSWYENNAVKGCGSLASCCPSELGTPGEACCWCGGGSSEIAPTTSPPTNNPSLLPVLLPTKSDTTSPTIPSSTMSPTSSPGITPIPSPPSSLPSVFPNGTETSSGVCHFTTWSYFMYCQLLGGIVTFTIIFT